MSDESKALDKMTVKELRDLAKAEFPQLTGLSAMKKEELLAAIRKEKGETAGPAKPVKKAKTPKRESKPLTVTEMKAKIVDLKKEKVAAKGADDQKTARILRRRINRLKKKTRRSSSKAQPQAQA
jgi:hypothetical protein